MRTNEETLLFAKEAFESGSKVCGIKGPSIMSQFVYKYIISMGVDQMHTAFGGGFKQLLSLWFDVEYKDSPFSLYQYTDLVDSRIATVRLPSSVTRSMKSIKDRAGIWKMSQYKTFLFYFSIVTLHDIMRPDYFNHFLLFALANYTLSQNSISTESVELSDKLFFEFVAKFPDLYTIDDMTINIHMLRHFAESVKRNGPLYTTSCFPLENLNGILKSFVHGSKAPELQIYICSNVSTFMSIRSLKNEMVTRGSSDSEAMNFAEKLSSNTRGRGLEKTVKISEGLYVVSENISKHLTL